MKSSAPVSMVHSVCGSKRKAEEDQSGSISSKQGSDVVSRRKGDQKSYSKENLCTKTGSILQKWNHGQCVRIGTRLSERHVKACQIAPETLNQTFLQFAKIKIRGPKKGLMQPILEVPCQRAKIHLGLFNLRNYEDGLGYITEGMILRSVTDTREGNDVTYRIIRGSYPTRGRVQRGLKKKDRSRGMKPQKIWKVQKRRGIFGDSKEDLKKGGEEEETNSRALILNASVGPTIQMDKRIEALNMIQFYEEEMDSQLEIRCLKEKIDGVNNSPLNLGLDYSSKPRKEDGLGEEEEILDVYQFWFTLESGNEDSKDIGYEGSYLSNSEEIPVGESEADIVEDIPRLFE
ncbi:hypothetical protein L484_009319 [Morus notabilis]|uniref:Uncharacterized protein n=1 Tax=Morus notabilis TaxID=981085 RepID=W9REZ3_9ROSA|nr:hypothetical protein L484_009319 [Morus notabilis]